MSQKFRISIIVVISLLFIGGYIFFFLKLRSINKEVGLIQSEIAKEDEREAGLKIAGKSLADTEKEREVLDSFFVEKEGLVDFIEKMESIAARNAVQFKIDGLKLERTDYDTVETIELRIIGSGTYSAVINFQKELEEIPVAIEWTKVTIAESISSEGDSNWQISAELRVLKNK